MPQQRIVAVLAVLGFQLVAGCSAVSQAQPAQPAPPAAAAGVAAEGGHAESDVTFSQEMIVHHRMTIMLAEPAVERGGSAYVRDLARELIDGEKKDITQMTSWLRSWKAEVPEESHAGHDMAGMASAKDVEELKGLSGSAFDRAWLKALADHLEAGVKMSEVAQAMGKHAPTVKLARRLVEEQREQVAAIKEHLA
ncbi:DUF305 domain-containing protein [Nonomuraea sp. SMC257]|uniref:DUF305 domain-containing protein n=1 Tax=Nonomuraea montanisoli TaxID=2741721 RepID=A0A7Y6I6W9_9ACTN|nr:DUF305 domain-containing protein [Nonomuraea montanisoli]NUW32681.1 DUF305 domain-containing protein [Nonomuraea montanisoli]